MYDQPESAIDELGLINDMKASPPPMAYSEDLMRKLNVQVHEHWQGNPLLNGELIVILDKNGRLTACGYPHGSPLILLERRKTRRVCVHTIQNSIAGFMYDIVKMTNEINGDWAWEPDKGMSIETLMNMMGTASLR